MNQLQEEFDRLTRATKKKKLNSKMYQLADLLDLKREQSRRDVEAKRKQLRNKK